MKKAIVASLFCLSLSACGTGPQMMSPPAAPTLRANTAPTFNANYSFRKPQGTLNLKFDTTKDREQGLEFFKAFMHKYVDKDDIFNYQIVETTSTYEVNINIYGGDKEFVKGKLLRDVLYYLRQRVDIDDYNIYG